MIERAEWDELPEVLRAAVEERTGRVVAAEPIEQGLNCAAALALTTAGSGTVFLKGVRDDDSDAVAQLLNEARVNAAVCGISPGLHLAAHTGGWRALVFEYVEGHTADLGPGSPDLDAVTATLRRMEGLRTPSVAPGIPRLADRYAAHLAPGDAELLHGPHLLHTDTNPHNLLVSPSSAYVVDWAMPALGPAWVDVALTAVRLMEAGQTSAAALAWLDRFLSWQRADAAAVRAFVSVACLAWSAMVSEEKARSSNARYRVLLDGVRTSLPG